MNCGGERLRECVREQHQHIVENDHQQTTKQQHESLLLLLLLLLLDKHSHRRSGGSGGGTDKHGTLTPGIVSDLGKE